MPFLRSDGSEADDGEAGGAQDPLRAEKNDRRGDGRQQQRDQLQGLCQDDAGQALSCAQTVSKHFFLLLIHSASYVDKQSAGSLGVFTRLRGRI